MGFSEAQEELVLRSWKAMKSDSESTALKFFLRCVMTLRTFACNLFSMACVYSGTVIYFRAMPNK